jgi:hypothetical protein
MAVRTARGPVGSLAGRCFSVLGQGGLGGTSWGGAFPSGVPQVVPPNGGALQERGGHFAPAGWERGGRGAECGKPARSGLLRVAPKRGFSTLPKKGVSPTGETGCLGSPVRRRDPAVLGLAGVAEETAGQFRRAP